MPAILLVALKYWKQAAGLLLILAAIFTMGNSIYNWGYSSAKEDWDAAIAERNRIQVSQTAAIVDLSKSVILTSDVLTKQSNDNLEKIIMSVKNKPMYILEDGKCVPSKEFETTFLNIIREGNKK